MGVGHLATGQIKGSDTTIVNKIKVFRNMRNLRTELISAPVAAIFDGVLLPLSLSCAGEAISSAQAPLEVSTACRRQG